MTCNHQCSSNCRREGCRCLCGEYHCDPDVECLYKDNKEAPCPNHPTMYERITREANMGMLGKSDMIDLRKLSLVLEQMEKKIEELQPKKIKIMADRAYYEDMDGKMRSFEITPPHTDTEKLFKLQKKHFDESYELGFSHAKELCIEIVKKHVAHNEGGHLIAIIQSLSELKK